MKVNVYIEKRGSVEIDTNDEDEAIVIATEMYENGELELDDKNVIFEV